jgi:hypothetical protein
MPPATQPALSPAHAGAEQQAARSRNGSGHESWEHVAPQGKGSMGPPAVPASRSAAHTGAYSSGAYNASYALPHERAGAAQSSAYAAPHSAGAHPASKSATGGGSHGHRPVSAMPAPVRSHAPSAAMPHDAGVLASMNAGASYNERRASAHPTVSASHTTGAIAPPMPISPSGTGLDATTSNAISSGIPITSPAALSYFAAHPRRQQVHFGSYLLLQTLGEGEFGKVKLGVHKEWGEEVAVKLIKREKVGTPDGQLNINGPKDPAKMSKVEREIQVLKVSRAASAALARLLTPRRTCATRTSCVCTRSSSRTATSALYSSMRRAASSSTTSWRTSTSRSATRAAYLHSSSRACRTCTRRRLCTAISSSRTCCWTATATSSSPTLASPTTSRTSATT